MRRKYRFSYDSFKLTKRATEYYELTGSKERTLPFCSKIPFPPSPLSLLLESIVYTEVDQEQWWMINKLSRNICTEYW